MHFLSPLVGPGEEVLGSNLVTIVIELLLPTLENRNAVPDDIIGSTFGMVSRLAKILLILSA